MVASFTAAIVAPLVSSAITQKPLAIIVFYLTTMVVVQICFWLFWIPYDLWQVLFRAVIIILSGIGGWIATGPYLWAWSDNPMFKWGSFLMMWHSRERKCVSTFVWVILSIVFIGTGFYEWIYCSFIHLGIPGTLFGTTIWTMDSVYCGGILFVLFFFGFVKLSVSKQAETRDIQVKHYAAYSWVYIITMVAELLYFFGLFFKYVPGIMAAYDDFYVALINVGIVWIWGVIVLFISYIYKPNPKYSNMNRARI